MLTRSVLPCVGRGLSYGIMKAGMRGRLAFCTFPDARESHICDGGFIARLCHSTQHRRGKIQFVKCHSSPKMFLHSI